MQQLVWAQRRSVIEPVPTPRNTSLIHQVFDCCTKTLLHSAPASLPGCHQIRPHLCLDIAAGIEEESEVTVRLQGIGFTSWHKLREKGKIRTRNTQCWYFFRWVPLTWGSPCEIHSLEFHSIEIHSCRFQAILAWAKMMHGQLNDQHTPNLPKARYVQICLLYLLHLIGDMF